MSSRQRARLAASLRAERAERPDEGSGDSSEEEGLGGESVTTTAQPAAQPAFNLLCSDSDSDSDSGVPGRGSAAEPVVAPEPMRPQTKNAPKKKKKKKGKPSDGGGGAARASGSIDDEIAAALEEAGLERDGPSARAGAAGPALAGILAVDPRSLDVDSLIRQRFAGAAADTGAERAAGRRGNAKQHVHRLGGAGRFIFGMPKDEWLKPPSYVGGGVGMAPARPSADLGTGDAALGARLKGAREFQFIWADEYAKVNDQFRAIQQSGDANRLVAFLSQYHYHQEGLLQLAMVFARTGQMDRASDLVRRCLFCIHCAEADAFRPCAGGALLNPAVAENKIYFAAVFRHMQIVGMLGCPSVAAAIAKLLLSLNPFGDAAHVLLCLDYYLIAGGEAEQFEDIYGHAEELILGVDLSDSLSKGGSAGPSERPYLALSCLPGWCYSAALNAFLRFRKCGVYVKYESDGAADSVFRDLADSRLRHALRTYPFFLHYLLPSSATAGGGGGGVVGTASSVVTPAQWQLLLADPFYQAIPSSRAFAVLAHLGDIYRVRSSTLWGNKKAGAGGASSFVDVEKWVYDIAVEVLESVNSAEMRARHLAVWEELCARPELRKYLSAELDDFMEEFPRLPPDANPLDPQFADPRALLPAARGAGGAALRAMEAAAGPRRPNHNRRVVDPRGRGMAEDDDEEAHIMRQLAQFEAQEAEMLEQMMRQEQEIGLLNQYARGRGAGPRGGGETLLRRVASLPKPLKDFLCTVIAKRVRAGRDGDAGDDDDDMGAFIDEESLLAEVELIRAADTEGEARAVDDAELQAIISEVMRRSPEDIFAEHSAQTGSVEEAETLDLNQPLMQLFLRSFLPWNALDPAVMRR